MLFEELQNDTAQLRAKYPNHKYVQTGDFNGQTGTLNDQTECTEDDFGMVCLGEALSLPMRNNQDREINRTRKELINFCHSTNLIIANGRVNVDKEEKYTYLCDLGCSTIYYCLCSPEFFHNISQFEIDG